MNYRQSFKQMKRIIEEMPGYFKIGEKIKIRNRPKKSKNVKNIVICGMGGSALGGLFLKSLFDKLPVIIHRDYGLPKEADKNSLIICNSYSGGTEETISSYLEAEKRNLKTYSVSTGGKLAELCEKNKTPWLEIPLKNIPPRTSVFLQLPAIVKILENEKLITGNIIGQFKKAAEKINLRALEKSAKNLARKAAGKIILIYSDGRLAPFAYHLKISVNENAKIHAFLNTVPECVHNEIVGFSKHSKNAGNFLIFFLTDGKEHRRNEKKMEIFAKLAKKRGFLSKTARLKGKNEFEKIINSTLFNNWFSFYLAKHYKEDVSATVLIDELKKKMVFR